MCCKKKRSEAILVHTLYTSPLLQQVFYNRVLVVGTGYVQRSLEVLVKAVDCCLVPDQDLNNWISG